MSIGLLAAFGPGFAWGTLAANAAGSFLIGLYAGAAGPGGRLRPSPVVQAFVVAGFCGGFTTFSIFSLETLQLAEAGEGGRAAAFVAASVVLWFAGVAAGHSAGRRLFGRRSG